MSYKAIYEKWLVDPVIDNVTKSELIGIASNEKEIEDRFYRELEFGTGGLRGVLGAGTNRLNIYTIRKATQGLANYILQSDAYKTGMAVAIAHDCRRMSPEFSTEAALVLNANGIKTYTFDSLRPTPLLSFAVRHLGCVAGIVVTASHNPPEYNGYKVYWSDGGQITDACAAGITAEINKVDKINTIKTTDRPSAEVAGLFHIAKPEVDDAYVQAVLKQRVVVNPADKNLANSDLKIVFSPLHGAGNVPIRRILAEAGYKNVYVVEEQAEPDGNFPTVAYPNPEEHEVFTLAEKLAREKDADIMICTDPDADRLGVAIKHYENKSEKKSENKASYKYLNGNMMGVLLMDYLLSQKKRTDDVTGNATDAIVSTIVSTDMGKVIARSYGVTYFEVLTGFKYIGEMIKDFEESEQEGEYSSKCSSKYSSKYSFVFGFEESYGYLAGTYARDKDAVLAALLVCDAADYYARQDMTLWDAMVALYKKHGYFKEDLQSITLKGSEGLENIRRIMANLRANPPQEIGGVLVAKCRDYLKDGHNLPKSDVLYYVLADDSWICVRPSGTEPKIKLYFGTVDKSDEAATAKIAGMKRGMELIIAN